MSGAGRYRVHPEGVSAVLSSVRSSAADLADVVRPLPDAAAGAGAAADGTAKSPFAVGLPGEGLIGAAVAALLDAVGGDLRRIDARVAAASGGLHDATRAVVEGDATMADEVEAHMLRVLTPVAAPGRRAR